MAGSVVVRAAEVVSALSAYQLAVVPDEQVVAVGADLLVVCRLSGMCRLIPA